MFTYDPDKQILKVQKYPEEELHFNLLQYQKQSYENYLNKTVLEDMNYMLDMMRDRLRFSKLDADFRVESRKERWGSEIKKTPPAYYPVTARFCADGRWSPGDPKRRIEVFRIPDMDDDGILNFDGSRYSLLMHLSADTSVSYDAVSKLMSVTLQSRNISFDLDRSADISLKYGNTNFNLHEVVRVFNIKDRVYDDLSKLFTSRYILSAFMSGELISDDVLADKFSKKNFYETYTGPNYVLGRARAAINEACSLRRAIGRTLSRPLGPYPVGTEVNEEVIRYTRKNLINEIYVTALPDIVGCKLADPIWFDFIPAGTMNCDLLRDILPEFSDYMRIPMDVEITDNVLILKRDHKLTKEDVQLLADLRLPYVTCKIKNQPLCIPFEEEIIGNCTIKLEDFYSGGNMPEGRSADEWVYFYNNPNLDPTDTDHLNTHDMVALYSLASFIRRNPGKNPLLDRDSGMLKRVSAAEELFSKSLRYCIRNFINEYANTIQRALSGDAKSDLRDDNFRSLRSSWNKYMRDKHYIESSNMTNPISSLAQVSHIVSDLDASNASDKVRLLAMGYYGRICPYETPNGKKLGITNTKAIGAIIEDGILKAPYRRVLKDSKGEIAGIHSRVEYFSATEEARFRIGDLISLKKENGKYVSTRVMARVPDPNNPGQVIVENIDASALDYVNAYCEQHLSPTAALVPFASADDAVRVTYATNMLKQSVLVQGSQKPRVFTSMYRHCFNHSNTFVVRAKKDGEVLGIDPGILDVQYTDGTTEGIKIVEATITIHSVNFLNFHVKEGDKFKKGDILVDSLFARDGIYSPGVNLFAAYLADGYEYEDAIAVSEHAANQLTSITNTTSTHQLIQNPKERVHAIPCKNYKYVDEGDEIFRVRRINKSDKRDVVEQSVYTDKRSGILYGIERSGGQRFSGPIEYTAFLLAFNRLRTGDKLAGRHSNKGTCSIIRKNSEMPCFANGRQVDILLNPCGVPSRMNIGQNFEAYLGFVATLLDIYIESDSFNGATRGDIKLLMHYVWDLANNADPKAVCAKYPMLPTSLHERAIARHNEIRDWEGCFNPDGTARLWNPATGKYLNNPVTFGVPYILKLEQEVNLKIHARGGMLEEEYSKIYKQPTDGSARGGGQRMGEMELFALAAYGASEFLYETQNSVSDNVEQRINMQFTELGYMPTASETFALPYSVEMFRYYLEALGLKLEDDEGTFPPMSRAWAKYRSVPDIRAILAEYGDDSQTKEKTDFGNDLRGLFYDG